MNIKSRVILKRVYLASICFGLLLHCSIGLGSEIQSMRMDVNAGWAKRFPQHRGVVRSYNISYTIFKRSGWQPKVYEYPTKRAKLALARGDLDIHQSSPESFGPHEGNFIRSELPITYLSWHIYYNNRNWQPQWPPDEEFKQKLGKSKMSWRSLRDMYGLNIKPANSIDSIIKMLHMERIDYWLDYSSTAQLADQTLFKSALEGYSYDRLFSRAIYIYFNNSAKGHRLKKDFETGIKNILEKGEYNTLYYANQPLHHDEVNTDAVMLFQQDFPQLEYPAHKQATPN